MGSSISSFLSSNLCASFASWVSDKANYFCSLKDNLGDLDDACAKLRAFETDVMTEVQNAEENRNMPMQRKEAVNLWLQRVKTVEADVAKLEKDRSVEMDRLCLGGCCSKNFKSSYRFGKQVAHLKKTVTTLKDGGGNFKHDVAVRAPAAPVNILATDQTIVGQQWILDQVLRCLREEAAEGIIGLYGPGGVGKTTLLTQINNKLSEESNGFQVVIWVVVSQKPSVEKIQEDIGKRIGFSDESWKKRSAEEKAQDISNALAKKKFALLLDDIWNWIDLTQVGIPLQSLKSSGSGIVFTTRKRDVCDNMKSKTFAVKCLVDEEAWKLFQETVGSDTLSDPSILEQARILYKECDGLPLALVVIGRAMSSKRTRQEWELAIQDLKTLSSEFPGMEDKVYSRLKYSYNNLSKDIVRSCFLYCSLFPEDHNILKRDFLDCWVGEGFVDVYNRGFSIIGELVHACLLEEVEREGGDECVKMHDVIRDMALWIAKEEQENFLVEAGVGLTRCEEVEKWKGIKRLSLMTNQIVSLPATIDKCPDLITLFLESNKLKKIADDYFQSMPSLKVFDLAYNFNMEKLPLGISNLESLQHLDLSYCEGIHELPETLRVLVNLKCLKAELAYKLCTISKQLISELKKLQVLRIIGCDLSNRAGKESVLYGGSELLVEELFELKYLNALSLTIKSSHAFQNFLSSDKLKSCTQSLHLKHFKESTLNLSFLEDLKNLDVLCITLCNSLQFLEINRAEKFNIGTHGFHNIQKIVICKCSDLHDLTWFVLAPNLKVVSIGSCDNLEEIISVEKLREVQKMGGNLNPFEKLQFLDLRDMGLLQGIHPNVLPFPLLKVLSVNGCPNLKKLPLDSNNAKNRQIHIYGEEHWWKELQWEDEATKNDLLPCYEGKGYFTSLAELFLYFYDQI